MINEQLHKAGLEEKKDKKKKKRKILSISLKVMVKTKLLNL